MGHSGRRLTKGANARSGFWLIPVQDEEGECRETATEILASWLNTGRWGMIERTRHREHIQPGDRVCFYVGKVGAIVAHAIVRGPADTPVTSENWPERCPLPDYRVYEVPLEPLEGLDFRLERRVPLDRSLRARLEICRGKSIDRYWSWLVRSPLDISRHDFVLLVGQEPDE